MLSYPFSSINGLHRLMHFLMSSTYVPLYIYALLVLKVSNTKKRCFISDFTDNTKDFHSYPPVYNMLDIFIYIMI